jgi:hypothetical protein
MLPGVSALFALIVSLLQSRYPMPLKMLVLQHQVAL